MFDVVEKTTGKRFKVYAVEGENFLIWTNGGGFALVSMCQFAPVQGGAVEDVKDVCTLRKSQYESADLDTLLYRMASGDIPVETGDTISMRLTDGTEVDLVVTDHDDDTIRFESRDCLGINTSADNLESYLDKVYSLLPEALKKRIIETDRKHIDEDGDSYTEHCKLFVPAASEIFPPDECYGDRGVYQQLEWYRDVHHRVRAEHRGGDSHWYWTSSPNASNSSYFCCVNGNGSANGNGASDAYGLAPFGCIISKI